MTGRLLLVLSMGLLSACGNTQPTEEATPSIAGCYVATIGSDNAYLDLKTSDERSVRGILEYAFSQKDTSWGLISGTSTSIEVNLDYQYLSEGLLSTRTVTLKRDGEKLSGEGWSYERSATCGIGSGWQNSSTSNVRVDTFHDPETGYYARSFFKIAGPTGGYSYRCIASVAGKSGSLITEWVGAGITDASSASRTQNMQTNIRPEQVSEISGGSVTCQTRTS